MSVNSFNSSLDLAYSLCLNFTVSDSIIIALFTTRLILLIPLYIFVLHLGIQQWRQRHSFQTASHSDIFTYNLAVMELILSLGTVLFYWGAFTGFIHRLTIAYFLISMIFFGETSFHVLTCVDRYLAVVHPVTYRELRNTRGVTIRNIGIFCVWVLSLLLSGISGYDAATLSIILFFTVFTTTLVVVSFCSLSVLFALIRPGPGAEGGNRDHIDQSKQRAFFTVMVIVGVLCLFFLGFLVPTVMVLSEVFCKNVSIMVQSALMWLTLPSSLVSPLLYLHKTGKLPCGHQGGRSTE